MTQASTSPFQVAAKYGVFTGVGLIVFSAALYLLGFNGENKLTYLNYVFLAIGIYLGTKEYRDKVRSGFINYGQALGAGALISLFAGLLLAAYMYVFLKFLGTEVIDEMLKASEDELIRQGMSDSEIDQAMKYTSMIMVPGFISAMVVIMHTLIGFVISLIVAAVLKRESNSFEDMVDNT